MNIRLLFLAGLFVLCSSPALAQDTLKISFEQFLTKAINNSGLLKHEAQNVALAENRIAQARATRFVPNLRLDSQHGLVPGVKSSNPNLSPHEYYLDPGLRNDWEDWAIYTKFQVTAAQPIFTWGAINKAVEAAKKGAEAAHYGFEAQKSGLEAQLFDLYFSYVLALEIERLLEEAQSAVNQIDRQIKEMQEEGSTEIEDADIFQFEIFKSEFEVQKAEVYENLNFVRQTWKYFLRDHTNAIYEPEVQFLDPLEVQIQPLDFYQRAAFNNRPEIKALTAGEEATKTLISSLKKQQLPGIYLGGFINFANTPNRPRQANPFIQNTTNLFNGGMAFTIRQNLNFFSIKANLERSRIELRKISYARDAAEDGILLEINNNYRKAALAEVRVEKTDEALVTSKKWVRQEQLDYDFGMGDVKNLIDAMRKEMELKLQLKQRVFEYNSSLAKLNISAGIPLSTLFSNSN